MRSNQKDLKYTQTNNACVYLHDTCMNPFRPDPRQPNLLPFSRSPDQMEWECPPSCSKTNETWMTVAFRNWDLVTACSLCFNLYRFLQYFFIYILQLQVVFLSLSLSLKGSHIHVLLARITGHSFQSQDPFQSQGTQTIQLRPRYSAHGTC